MKKGEEVASGSSASGGLEGTWVISTHRGATFAHYVRHIISGGTLVWTRCSNGFLVEKVRPVTDGEPLCARCVSERQADERKRVSDAGEQP